jgi:hypothetical protein
MASLPPPSEHRPLLQTNASHQPPKDSRGYDPELASETSPSSSLNDDTAHTHTISKSTRQRKEKRNRCGQISIKAPVQFALRMAILMVIWSLFVLVRTKGFVYPDGMWVLVSVLFLCWFSALDAASVIEKIVKRLSGTFVSAFFGLVASFCRFSCSVIRENSKLSFWDAACSSSTLA